MNYDNLSGFSLQNTGSINVILGKNGCGKSFLMKTVGQALRNSGGFGNVRYINPERAGTLIYQAGVDQSVNTSPTWINDTRNRNQLANFKEQSVSLFRRLELITLREIETEHTQAGYTPKSFQDIIDKINTLLDRIKIERSSTGFTITEKDTVREVNPDDISSGESELVSLGIEFLAFEKECVARKQNFLLIDEPDVHLHPDLQDRLATFLANELDHEHITIIISTHSTPLLAALARKSGARVAFMLKGNKELNFEPINDVQKRILPMYGAHPLSNIFNEAPLLLLEGEDDERIWQQVVRTSIGRINLYPCATDSITNLNEHEQEANKLLNAVYDNAKGYSLRDRDETPEEIADVGSIIRMKLSCRAAENLILSDDVLQVAGLDWSRFQELLVNFASESTHHPYHSQVKAFIDEGFDRKMYDLKHIRMVIAGHISNKPWEVLVGQTIANLTSTSSSNEGSLRDFLGEKVCREILSL